MPNASHTPLLTLAPDAEFIAAIGDPVLDSFNELPPLEDRIAAGEADSVDGECLPPSNDGAPHTQNDIGNVDILAERTRGNLRYVKEDDNWLYWGGNRWVVDTAGSRLLIACKSVAEHYATEADRQEEAAKCAAKSEDAARMRKTAAGIRAWSIACGNRQRIDAMRALAKQDGRFAISASRLDTDPWLFGVANGVVDLRTGKLRPDSRGDYVTRRSPVAFDENAPAARWQDFVSEISSQPLPGGMRPRAGLASYLQKALGYSLTGSTREHKMFIAQGAGSNGKSVLLDIVKLVIGTDYCRVIPPAALMAARFDNGADAPSPIVRSLAGARLALSSESKDRQRLDAAVIKAQTGGGSITARGLHQNPLTFEITHKLWLMTNPKPDVDHLDAAFRGRLHMIPFSMRWNRPGEPGRDPLLPDGDKGLFDALRAELPGVLAWLVRGAVAYWQEGLEPPEEVAQMTRDYFESQDALGQWLKTAEPCDPRAGASAAVLFEDFRNWCADEGRDVQPATQTAFGRGLAERKIAKFVGADRARYAIKGNSTGMGFA